MSAGTLLGVGEELSFTRKTGLHPVAGGAAGLTYPLFLILLALTGGFRQGGDVADPATSILGALIFLVAAPTAWVFAIEFIEADRFTVLFVGAMTSLPLWWLLGSRLARTAADWRQWAVRYLRISVGWSLLVLLIVVLVAGW